MKRDVIWRAVYDDGSEMIEGSYHFNDITKNKLKEFRLCTPEYDILHLPETGQLMIAENAIVLLLNGKQVGISKDVINCKEVIKGFFNPDSKYVNEEEAKIIGYYTGWKEKNEDFSNIEVLVWLDLITGYPKLRIRATPTNPKILESKLSIIISGFINNEPLIFENINKTHTFAFDLFGGE